MSKSKFARHLGYTEVPWYTDVNKITFTFVLHSNVFVCFVALV